MLPPNCRQRTQYCNVKDPPRAKAHSERLVLQSTLPVSGSARCAACYCIICLEATCALWLLASPFLLFKALGGINRREYIQQIPSFLVLCWLWAHRGSSEDFAIERFWHLLQSDLQSPCPRNSPLLPILIKFVMPCHCLQEAASLDCRGLAW